MRERKRERKRERVREKGETDRLGEIGRGRQRERDRERKREKDTETERQTEREKLLFYEQHPVNRSIRAPVFLTAKRPTPLRSAYSSYTTRLSYITRSVLNLLATTNTSDVYLKYGTVSSFCCKC